MQNIDNRRLQSLVYRDRPFVASQGVLRSGTRLSYPSKDTDVLRQRVMGDNVQPASKAPVGKKLRLGAFVSHRLHCAGLLATGPIVSFYSITYITCSIYRFRSVYIAYLSGSNFLL